MAKSIIDTYGIKCKIIGFFNKSTKDVGKVQTKFVKGMIYGLAILYCSY
ncbi:MAG: hypothetical protein MUO60_03955 [Clostridiaceae bacterium]|nr:hypothetical protein [Clostridiaceae bacterium]